MKISSVFIFLLCICFAPIKASSSHVIDSLVLYTQNEQSDSLLAKTFNEIATEYKGKEPAKSLEYAQKALKISNQNSSLIDAKLSAYNLIGLAYKHLYNFKAAKEFFQKGLRESVAQKMVKYEARLSSNLGNIYFDEGDFDQASKLYFQSLKAEEAKNDTLGIIVSYITLGAVYGVTEKYDKSLNYFKEALSLCLATNNEPYSQYCHNNIGQIYVSQENYYEALEHFKKSLSISEKFESKSDIAWSLNNIGVCYLKLRDLPMSLKSTKRALDIRRELGEKRALATSLGNYADIFFELKDYPKANELYREGLELAHEINANDLVKNYYQILSEKNEIRKDYKTALSYHKLYASMKDSLINQSSEEKIAELETIYKTEKQQREIDLLNTEKELKNAELDKKSFQQKILILGLLGALLLIVYVAYNLVQKKKTNTLLNEKNEIIEEKNKDITDSIYYAQRIQDAILPEKSVIQNHFDSFIFYKPKDIVSGDFYWAKQIENKIYFAVVDCTGHGVPGAFMSIIGYNSLNRIVDDLKIENTGLILDELNKQVIKALGKQEKEEFTIRDGMDLSICCIDLTTNQLEFSGANNGLYVIRKKGKSLKELEPVMENDQAVFYEIKPNKMAIGGGENMQNYTSHQVDLKKGDNIILFSDGFPDQFGGEKGKKFMYKRFKGMLFSSYHLSATEQEKFIADTLRDWKGEQEQLDDICIMGVKIS